MPFLEAVASLQARAPKLIKDRAKFKFEEYLRAFSISGVSKINQLVATQSALEKALAKGFSFAQFLKANPNFLPQLDKKRTERIFTHNLIYANTRGKMLRYENAPPIADSSNGDGWYFVFHSRHDDRARHLAYDSICLPRKHPFWKTHTPPLDWGCRCRLSMHSKEELKRYNRLNDTHYQITPTPPPSVRSAKEKNAFESDVYKFLHNFFNAKLQRYAGNKEAMARLASVVRVCEAKKMRFKKLIELSKSPEQIIDFATLKPEIMQVVGAHTPLIKLQGAQMNSHLEKHKHTDLFDYYLAQDILQEPLLIAKDKGFNVAIGVKFGRWYKIAIKILKGENWLSSLMWTSTKEKLERNLGNKENILYKDPKFGL